MPLKEETELQLLRSLSNTPLQVDVTFITVSTHEFKNASMSHLKKFYETFSHIKHRFFNGLIITGAPIEQMDMRMWITGERFVRFLNLQKRMSRLRCIFAGEHRQGFTIITV